MKLSNLLLNIVHERALFLALLLFFFVGATLPFLVDQDVVLVDVVYLLLKHVFGFVYDTVLTFQKVHLGHIFFDLEFFILEIVFH